MSRLQEKHLKSVKEGFDYYGEKLDDFKDIDAALKIISDGKIKIDGCAYYIASLYKYNGLLYWFKERNLIQTKQDFYVAAKSEIIRSIEGAKPHYECSHKLYALVSDNEEIINWYAQDVGRLYLSYGKGPERNRVNDFAYAKFNFFLAMQGDWDLLAARSEYILANPPMKKYQHRLPHHVFFLALAKGDAVAMKAAIDDIVAPKRLLQQNMSGCPQSRFFLSYWGTLYAKMAWRHGYELIFDHPWIPQEWLPIQPLSSYKDPHDFLTCDIYTPYKNEYEKYSPQRDKKDWLDLAEGSWPPI